jgi:hypothetical protein
MLKTEVDLLELMRADRPRPSRPPSIARRLGNPSPW